MPYTAPTRSEIFARIRSAYRLETSVDPLQRSIEIGLLVALMGESKGQYGFISYIFRQLFADTADAYYFWRWAGIFGIDQKPATPQEFPYTITGTDTTVIPVDAVATRSDGQTYLITDGGTIGEDTTGEVVVSCVAVTAGTAANCLAGQRLVLASPISGADDTGIVGTPTHAGTDIENQTDGLVRLLLRLRTQASGGGPGDYVRWALEVAGATRAWEFANLEGTNSVSVAFVRDGDFDPDDPAAILPDSTARAEMLTYLESVAPITVDVRVIELVAQPIDVEIADLLIDTPETRDAIETELQDFFLREGEPGGTLLLSRLDAAISAADGETSHTLNDPSASIDSTTAQMPILGSLTFV